MARSAGKRSVAWWVGLGLVLAGLAVLGWVGWQFFGTNWVSQRTHSRVVAETERSWEQSSPDESTVRVDGLEVVALVRIPEFGDDYVVPLLEGTTDRVLASGFGMIADSAGPGEVGNFAIAGHRVTHGEPLRDMPSLEVGDEIVIETRTQVFTYALTTGGDDLDVPFTAGWVLDALPTNPREGGVQPEQREGQRLLSLTTCSELFHTDNRLVAFAELIDSAPRG